MKCFNKKISLWLLCLVALVTMGAKVQSDSMKFGRKVAENLTIEFDIGAANNPRIFWNNATSKLRFTNNGTTFFDLGSGSGGGGGSGVNLVQNPGYEEGIGTTFTYKDAAAVSPVDGTGGSPTLTAAITTTGGEVLRGLQSLKVTKPASNTQGEGVSIPVTIEELDKGKLLQISFDFKTQSGYTSEDFRVYLIETTGPTVIQPTVFKIPAGTGTFRTTVQSRSQTSYRLVVHTATTSTAASSFILDNISFGPNVLPSVPAIATGIPFTGGGSWVTNTTYTASYDRKGKLATVHYKILTSGAVTAAALSLDLPPGVVPDTSAPGWDFGDLRQRFGDAASDDSGATTYEQIGVYYQGGLFKLITVTAATNALVAEVNNNNPFSYGAGDAISASFTFPVAGWSEDVYVENTTVQHICNSSVTDADDTTSFVSSEGGCRFPSATATRNKRVRSSRPLGPNEYPVIKVSFDAGVSWFDIGVSGNISNLESRNSVLYGMGVLAINSTDFDVTFGTYRSNATATYGAAGPSWTDIDNDPNSVWKVVIASNTNSVAFDTVGQNKPGLVNGAGQLLGTNTNDSACVGCVGELLESYVIDSAAVSAASITDMTSLVLTAGEWDVKAHCLYSGNATVVLYQCGVSDVSATYVGDISISAAYSTAPIATTQGHTLDHERTYKVAAGTTKTVYNVISGNYTGTLQASGSLKARRVR